MYGVDLYGASVRDDLDPTTYVLTFTPDLLVLYLDLRRLGRYFR